MLWLVLDGHLALPGELGEVVKLLRILVGPGAVFVSFAGRSEGLQAPVGGV